MRQCDGFTREFVYPFRLGMGAKPPRRAKPWHQTSVQVLVCDRQDSRKNLDGWDRRLIRSLSQLFPSPAPCYLSCGKETCERQRGHGHVPPVVDFQQDCTTPSRIVVDLVAGDDQRLRAMAPREDIVTSAVTFLQDPSVASAPVEKRIEFLKSKNLTQEEIGVALARAQEDPLSLPPRPSGPPNTPPYYGAQQYRRAPPYGSIYDPYGYGPWQPPPPEPPRRDWRDWFIMATVVGGAGYGLWVLAQRYVKPLIAPPTPPQLEQDKAAIDEQFNRTFALLDTLSSDTAALKEAEEARTRRLDAAITDVEAIVAELKAASTRREDDAKRMEQEIKGMKDSLPKAIDGVREGSERQLKELGAELGSLKLLISNRLGGGAAPAVAAGATGSPNPNPSFGPSTTSGGIKPSPATTTTSTTAASGPGPGSSDLSGAVAGPGASTNVTGVNSPATLPSFASPGASSPYFASAAMSAPTSGGASGPVGTTTTRPKPSAPYASTVGTATGPGKAATIPSWQMAASSKSSASKDYPAASAPISSPHTAASAASAAPFDGAEVVNLLNAS